MIWVELLSRHQEVASRQRCDGADVRIGRAYDNDVVIDDPFVAPHHLRVYRGDDGRLYAQDLGSRNGLWRDGAGRVAEQAVDGDVVLRVGRTPLRIRDADYAVAPERVATPATRLWPTTVTLALLSVLVAGLSLWLSETTEVQLSHYVLPLIATALLVLGWTTVWALLARIFSGAAHFERHLVIALCGLLAFFLWSEVSEYGTFALSFRALSEFGYVGNWLILAGLCFAHLREIGPLRLSLKAGTVVGLALAAIIAQTVTKSEMSSAFGQASYLQGLKPPMFRLRTPRSEDEFFAGTEKVKDAVDLARKKPVEGAGLLPELGGDD